MGRDPATLGEPPTIQQLNELQGHARSRIDKELNSARSGMTYPDDVRQWKNPKTGVTEDFPFGETTLCLRVAGKIFAITGLDSERFTVNLKCEPDHALELRERHPEVQPGWHMNKKHWNTVDFEGSMDEAMLRQLIDHSYEQVVKTLKKAERESL